jgi:hypothetical protein
MTGDSPFGHPSPDDHSSILDADLVPRRDHGALNRRDSESLVVLGVGYYTAVINVNRVAGGAELEDSRIEEAGEERKRRGQPKFHSGSWPTKPRVAETRL